MKLEEYKKDLLEREGLPITENIILFNDFELYFQDKDESIKFKTFEDVTEYEIDGKKIKNIIEEKEEAYSIHNHPTKALNKNTTKGARYLNAPSPADLRNWSLGRGKGTIVVASGNRTGYIMVKNSGFSGKAFTKEMNRAKSTGNYDKDVDKWLKKNQKGLKYKYTKIKF